MNSRRLRACAALLAACLLAGCATLRMEPLPDPIRPPKAEPAAAAEALPSAPEETAPVTRTSRTPGVVIQRTVAEGIADRLGQDLVGDPIRLSFHDVPLVPFINEVFGEELGMSFVISPGLAEKSDLVTLKLTEPLPPRQLFDTARRVLGEYGVEIREVEKGILSFAPSQESASRDVPLLVSGRTLPEVPGTHRTIFQLVPLKVMRGPQVRGLLKEAFSRKELDIGEDPDRNALLLKGSADTLARAMAMIEVLDQPLLRGRHGIIVEPVFMSAGELARALESVLRAEGYQASVATGRATGAVILIALEGVNKVIVFAADRSTVEHVEQWARTLDTRRKESTEEAVFTYEVRNTQAEELTGTLNRMLGSGAATAAAPEREDGEESGEPADGAPAASAAEAAGGAPSAARIVVDRNRNLILFRGSGKEWAELRAVIAKLDKSVPSVLIEVLVAEVSLSDEEKTGFEFFVRGALGSRGLSAGTLNTLGVGAGGLSLTLDSAGETRAMLNFFHKDDRGGDPRPAPAPGEERRDRQHRRRQRDPADHAALGFRHAGRRLHQRAAGGHLPQDRHAARDQATRAGERTRGPADFPAAQRSGAERRDQPNRLPHHPQPPDQHEPHAQGRGLPPHGRAHLRQPERGRERRAPPLAGAGARPPLPRRLAPGGPHRAAGDGHPLRGRGPRGRLGAHPSGARAARSAHRAFALMRCGRGPIRGDFGAECRASRQSLDTPQLLANSLYQKKLCRKEAHRPRAPDGGPWTAGSRVGGCHFSPVMDNPVLDRWCGASGPVPEQTLEPGQEQ